MRSLFKIRNVAIKFWKKGWTFHSTTMESSFGAWAISERPAEIVRWTLFGENAALNLLRMNTTTERRPPMAVCSQPCPQHRRPTVREAYNAGGLQQKFWASYFIFQPTHLDDSKHDDSNVLFGFTIGLIFRALEPRQETGARLASLFEYEIQSPE